MFFVEPFFSLCQFLCMFMVEESMATDIRTVPRYLRCFTKASTRMGEKKKPSFKLIHCFVCTRQTWSGFLYVTFSKHGIVFIVCTWTESSCACRWEWWTVTQLKETSLETSRKNIIALKHFVNRNEDGTEENWNRLTMWHFPRLSPEIHAISFAQFQTWILMHVLLWCVRIIAKRPSFQ